MPNVNHPTDPNQLTKEETAWLMKAIWAALQSPKWGFFNSKDLETLGKAIASGKALKDLDDTLLNKIWPHMLTVTQHLGVALKHQASLPELPSPTNQATVAADLRPDPRVADPRVADPRVADPRVADPRVAEGLRPDPRVADPRGAEPVNNADHDTELQ